jgi:hypothetical protein
MRRNERLADAQEIFTTIELARRATGAREDTAATPAVVGESPAEAATPVTRARAGLEREIAALTRLAETEQRKRVQAVARNELAQALICERAIWRVECHLKELRRLLAKEALYN